MPDIFLSYNREDQAVARRFAEAFAAEGFDVWWDATLKSGEAYDEVTEAALRTAKAVVVLWSPRSVVSRWVRAEATLADRNKTLVPCTIEPCDRPIMFELTQTAELSHWTGDVADKAWQAFLGDVRSLCVTQIDANSAPTNASRSFTAPIERRGEVSAIAIMPFSNRSGLPEDEVFAEGMVEDVIAALSLSGGVKVLASSATTAFRRGTHDLTAVGHQLGARYVLEGNVRRVAQHLRVTTQLVEAKSSGVLWTQRFDRPLEELASLQEDLVRELASHLGVQVLQQEMERALRKPGDLTAWEAVVRATSAWRKIGLGAAKRAVIEASTAVALAPDFGLARATLAHSQATLSAWRGGDAALDDEAIRNADQALALDPNNANVLWRAGRAYWAAGRANKARQVLEKAVVVNANLADARYSLGMAYASLGRAEQAIAELDAGDALAPHSFTEYLGWWFRGYAHLSASRPEAALAAVETCLALNPNYTAGILLKGMVCALLGRDVEALEAARAHRKRAPPGTTIDTITGGIRRLTTTEVVETLVRAYEPVWDLAAP